MGKRFAGSFADYEVSSQQVPLTYLPTPSDYIHRRPVAAAVVNDETYMALVDTGATKTIMSFEVDGSVVPSNAVKATLADIRGRPMEVSLVDVASFRLGQTRQSPAKLYRRKWYSDGILQKTPVVVGMDFLLRHSAVCFDWVGRTLHLGRLGPCSGGVVAQEAALTKPSAIELLVRTRTGETVAGLVDTGSGPTFCSDELAAAHGWKFTFGEHPALRSDCRWQSTISLSDGFLIGMETLGEFRAFGWQLNPLRVLFVPGPRGLGGEVLCAFWRFRTWRNGRCGNRLSGVWPLAWPSVVQLCLRLLRFWCGGRSSAPIGPPRSSSAPPRWPRRHRAFVPRAAVDVVDGWGLTPLVWAVGDTPGSRWWCVRCWTRARTQCSPTGWDRRHCTAARRIRVRRWWQCCSTRERIPTRERSHGTTPLHHAAHTDNAMVIAKLLAAGADAAAINSDGLTPLHHAKLTDAVRMLLDAGAPVDVRMSDGMTPLLFAAMTGNLGKARMLVDAGGDLHAAAEGDVSILHLATRADSQPELIRALLDWGADPRATSDVGLTPPAPGRVRHAGRGRTAPAGRCGSRRPGRPRHGADACGGRMERETRGRLEAASRRRRSLGARRHRRDAAPTWRPTGIRTRRFSMCSLQPGLIRTPEPPGRHAAAHGARRAVDARTFMGALLGAGATRTS